MSGLREAIQRPSVTKLYASGSNSTSTERPMSDIRENKKLNYNDKPGMEGIEEKES